MPRTGAHMSFTAHTQRDHSGLRLYAEKGWDDGLHEELPTALS